MSQATPPILTNADWAALTAVVYGTPSPADVARVHTLRSLPESAPIVAAVEADATAGGGAFLQVDTARRVAIAQAIVSASANREQQRANIQARPRLSQNARFDSGLRSRGIRIGVSILAGLLVAVTGWRMFVPIRDMNTSARAGHTYATTTGQTARMTLYDGTRVTLAPLTTLQLIDFGVHARVLRLEGEAYFEVQHASGTPFVVHTGAIRTEVLGTSFDIRRYAGERYAHIAVATGRIAVASTASRSSPRSILVNAGSVAVVGDSAVIDTSSDDAFAAAAWTSGALAFRSVRTEEVLTALSRWYGYQFRTTDPSLAERKLTARLSTQSSAAAFATLKLVLDVDLHFDGNTVTLAPKHQTDLPARPRSTSEDALSSTVHEVGK